MIHPLNALQRNFTFLTPRPRAQRILWLCLLLLGLGVACDDSEGGSDSAAACEGSDCVEACLMEGTQRCADAQTPEVCLGGLWAPRAPCSGEDVCVEGECSPAGTCQPSCDGRQCGADGCGGVCAECADPLVCNTDGSCVPVSVDCGDAVCGAAEDCATCPEDCGDCCGNGTCDTAQGESCVSCLQDCGCEDGQQCDATLRQCACAPQCGDRVCGDDGCGGQCGDCLDSEVCTQGGACQAIPVDCGNGACGADEDCATCPEDCGDCCGNGTCDTAQGEDCASCLQDCACSEGFACDAGVCMCEPQCEGRVCGDDGCGGQCGAGCGEEMICVEGACVNDCVDTSGSIAFNVEVVPFRGAFTTNGAAPQCPEYGRLYLVNKRTGSNVTLINDTCPSATAVGRYDVQVPVGTYDAFFSTSSCGPSIPCDSRALIEADIVVEAAVNRDLNINLRTLTGMFTTNGAAPQCPEYGRLYMVNRATGSNVTLINDTCPSATAVGDFDVQVSEGTYDVFFSTSSCGPSIPCDSMALVRDGFVIDRDRDEDLDIEVVPFRGAFTTNGAAPQCPEYGRLYLVNKRTGSNVTLINDTCPSATAVGRYDVQVPVGTYDAFFSTSSCGPSIPCDSRALIEADIVVEAAVNRDLNINLRTFTGMFTTNGAAPQCPEYGRLYMVNRATGSNVTLINDTCPSATAVGDFDVQVSEGTYDVFFSTSSCGPSIPCDSMALVRDGFVIDRDRDEVLNIEVVLFRGAFTTNGEEPQCPEYGRLYLVNKRTGSNVTLINDTCPSATAVGRYDVQVPVGTYDAFFSTSSCGPSIPCDSRALVEANIVVNDAENRDLNIEVYPLAGTFTTNGGAPQCPEYGRLYMVNRVTGSNVTLINDTCPSATAVGDFDVQVPEGTYDVFFSTSSCGPSIPCDSMAYVDCLNVP